MVEINWSQDSLDGVPRPALRIILEVLLDPEDETAVVSIEARTFPGKALVALTSGAPVDYSSVEYHLREVGSIFTRLIREHTGPFSP